MTWRRRALLGAVLLALVVFGGVADYALIRQGRFAREAALSDLDERARLTALSLRDTVGRLEKAVLDGAEWPGVMVAQVALRPPARPRPDMPPYGSRSPSEVALLLTSRALTASGLPEAVVAAVALGRADETERVADRLMSGQLPVHPDDLPQLARVLGADRDARLPVLLSVLRRAPDPVSLPAAPQFRRTLTPGAGIEGWSRVEPGLQFYAIAAGALLQQAGIADRAEFIVEPQATPDDSRRNVTLPELSGLTVAVAPDRSEAVRIRTLRAALWTAILISGIGLVAVVRALAREGRAIGREKAFLASVTHELRTPLAAIRVFGETLAERRGNPAEYGTLIARECERLDTLVEQVLATTRVDEAPVFTSIEPDWLIASAIHLVTPRADQRAVRIECEAADTPLPETYWDGDAVRRALVNLLDNAVKHGRRGGRVRVRSKVAGDRVELSVEDDGPGIGGKDRARVFGRFERGSTDSAGTGLGLYVVEQVARAHGGRVDLVSKEHQGSTFTLVLPIHPPVPGRGREHR